MSDISVLIIGAGPTGLTLACDLARRGVRFLIIDSATDHFAGSRAKGLMPRTLEVLEDLGVIDQVIASGGTFPPFRGYQRETVLWDRDIYTMAGFPRLEKTSRVPYTEFWMVPQWRTVEILRDRLVELGGRVELETGLTNLVPDDDGVLATISNSDGTENIRAEYVVGADGGRSFVRKSLGVNFLGESIDSDRSIIADVRAEGPDREHWHMWLNAAAPSNRVALCPLPATDVFQYVAPVTTEDVPDLTLESLQKIFDERSGMTNVRLSNLSWATIYRANIRMADRFRVGRVFLAGDAAHVHSPAGGQGLNTGIQDAYNLGWKLAAVLDGAPAELLNSYEDERLPVAANVLGFTTHLHQRGFKGAATESEREMEHDVNQLRLNYRGGPLSWERREIPGEIRAGDRAPDAFCHHDGKSCRLFDTFRGPHFTLLAFGENSTAIVTAINDQYRADVHAFSVENFETSGNGRRLFDINGDIRDGYGIHGNAIVLIRPDGYIGYYSDETNGAGVNEYLKMVLP